jgi:ubiquinone/menaquinone biosynthesis C-methylase UbiE
MTAIAFDRIASSYDTVRGHPPAVAAQIGQAIAGVAGAGAHILELGVGTGRIALPVAAAGPRVTGIDIAAEMLRVADGAGEGGGALRLVRGDVVSLPFADAVFDAALAVHVLHLVKDWRAALADAVRVLRPGGVLVQGRDWRDPASCAGRLRAKLREVIVEILPGIKPPAAGAAIPQALAKLGVAPAGELVAASWTSAESPAGVLGEMASRSDAETWVLDDDTLREALARLRAWAETVYSDLEAPEQVERRFVLSIARKG